MIYQSQPPLPSENDYGARPTALPDLTPEDWDQYDGEVREPEAKPNGSSDGLGEWDAGDDDAPIPPRGWLLGNVFCRRFVSSLLAEGIETGLSAMQLFDMPVWCSLSNTRLDRLELPSETLEVHIFGDNGTPGHEGAERAAKAYQGQGRRVVVRFPPERFGDFNDLLSAGVAA